MIPVARPGARLLVLLLAVLLLAGCAGKGPMTSSLESSEKERVRAAYAEFAEQACPLSLDGDVTLEMRMLGATEKSAGILQYEGPSSFRYTMVDPLGRSLFIMATDGYAFTMVYNREAKAVTGSTSSRFWRDYVPDGVSGADIVLLLAGRPPADLQLKDVRGDRDGAGFWLYGVGGEGIRHEILTDPQTSRVLRHIVKDGRETVLFDVRYDRYAAGDQPCPLPATLRVTGKTITGTLLLHLDRMFSGQPIPAQTFRITPPPHFQVQQMQ
jgi:outer membrane lipoprotein-sorting protein